jgi:hypothetical protein
MSTEISPEERAETRRERRIWTTITVVCVLVALGFLAWAVPIMKGRLDAAKKLDRAIGIVNTTGPDMLSADAIIGSEVNTETGGRAAVVLPLLDGTLQQLTEAYALIDAGYPKLTDDEQKQAKRVQEAAKARIDMLGAAPAIISATQNAAIAKWSAEQGWNRLVEADKLARKSVAAYNRHTRRDVTNAKLLNDNAKSGFLAAKALFSQAASAFPEAKLALFVDYADKRLALIAISKKADTLWLAGNGAKAAQLISAYNKGDAGAVAAAKKLPASPVVAIADAYKALTDAPRAAYVTARQKAAEADAALKSQ